MDPIAQRVAARFREAEGYDSRLPKLERILESVEAEVKQMRFSLNKYKEDPAKYKPQLGNVEQSVATVSSSLRVLLRVLGKE